MLFKLGEDELNLDLVQNFLDGEIEVAISEKKRADLKDVRKFVEDHIDSQHAYYGINTGFGKMAGVKIELGQLDELQTNLIRSHAFGVGELLSEDVVRVMMLLRAHVVAMGYSAPSLGIVDQLIEMINCRIIPAVPSQGSVGASGDLSPLAYLALAMMGEGDCLVEGTRIPSSDALHKAGLSPVKLHAKDGLTLINGTQAMTALSAIALLRARRLIKTTDLSAALSLEGFRGASAPFDEKVHKIRRQIGQVNSAVMIRRLTTDSQIISSHIHCTRVQDPYSFRCIPQVHGACRDAYYFAKDIVEREMNSCTDNPLVFTETDQIISGGNFHGEPLAMAMDMLSIGMAELGSIAERRLSQLISPMADDLPVPLLTKMPGLNSGFFMPHVVVSSLVSENKTSAHPASVDSIPTFGGQEDHVSMGMWASRKVHRIIDNVEWIGTIETMAACQAMDLHEEKHKPGVGTSLAYDMVRQIVKYMDHDRYLEPEAKALHALTTRGEITEQVEKTVNGWVI